MAEVVKSPEKTAELTSSPSKGSATEASLPNNSSAAVEAKQQSEEAKRTGSSPSKESVTTGAPPDSGSVAVSSKPQAQEIKHSRSKLRRFAPVFVVLLMAVALLVVITTNWNAWVGSKGSQKTDDAYLRADITPLSTRVSGYREGGRR
jgi:hypothetical protein